MAMQQVQASYTDFSDLNRIRQDGRKDQGAALEKVARQFESMLLHTMLKTMRESNDVFSEDSFVNSSEMKFHQGMFDQQLALTLSSGKGLGLSEALARQLKQQYASTDPDTPATASTDTSAEVGTRDVTALVNPFSGRKTTRSDAAAQIAAAVRQQGATVEEAVPARAAIDESLYELFTPAVSAAPAALARTAMVSTAADAAHNTHDAMAVNARSRTRLDSVALATGAYAGKKQPMAMTPEEFVAQVQPYAEQAARHLGVDARVLVAQAALETGWGRHVIHKANGVSSNNLFNIKAGGNWQDQRVSVSTLEYRNGVARQEKAAFRVYDGLQDSFNDYARLISGAGRYQGAMDNAASSYQYLREIQAAGYATDPDYADKVWRVFQSPALQNTVMASDTPAATRAAATPSTSATLQLSSHLAPARKG